MRAGLITGPYRDPLACDSLSAVFGFLDWILSACPAPSIWTGSRRPGSPMGRSLSRPMQHPVVQALAEIGLDISRELPKPLTSDKVQAADIVIAIGCGDACPTYFGKRYLDWDLPQPRSAVHPCRPAPSGLSPASVCPVLPATPCPVRQPSSRCPARRPTPTRSSASSRSSCGRSRAGRRLRASGGCRHAVRGRDGGVSPARDRREYRPITSRCFLCAT